MDKEFIPYEEASALKELGFDEVTLAYSYGKNIEISNSNRHQNSKFPKDGKQLVTIPLYQQAFRWFRKNHNIDSYIQRCGQGYAYQIYINFGTDENKSIPQKGWCNSPEEAEFVCLRKLIEIVKEKNNG